MYGLTNFDIYVRRIVTGLSAVIAISVFLYGGFLLGAVAHTAGRTTAERQSRTLSAAISGLESTFLAETKELSPERATAMGFVAPVSIATVYAGGDSLSVR